MTDIPSFFSQGDLYRLFSNYGEVLSIKLKKNCSSIAGLDQNNLLSSAKVTFENEEEAREALETLNGRVVCKNTKAIRIEYFNPENIFKGV